MERLTIPDERIDEHTTRRTVIDAFAVREDAMKFYRRLKAYEDAEEQGLLVRLPCKVGDTVYFIGRNRIDDVQVESIHCWISGMWKVSGRRGTGRFYAGHEFSFEDFGKIVFLAPEAADAALKEANRNG